MSTGAMLRLIGLGDATKRIQLLRRLGLYVPLRIARAGFPRLELERWRDLRVFRRRHRALRARRSARGGARTVLFAHLAPGVLVTQIHAMFATALAARGCRPVFVTYRDDLWHEEYLRALGHDDLLFIEDHLPPEQEYEERAEAMLRACGSADELLALRSGGAEVGRHAASRVLKNLRRASIDLNEDQVRHELRRALTRSLRTSVAAERIVADAEPAHLVVCEKGYTPWAECYDVALRRGVDTVHWYRSPFEYSLLFRRYTYGARHEHFFSLTDETWEEVKTLPWSEEQAEGLRATLRSSYLGGTWFARKGMLEGKRVKERDQLRGELGLDPAKPTAVVYSHVLFDATFWFGTSLFPDYGAWLVETIRRACANPAVNWVIKMHPENVTKAQMAGGYEIEQLEEYRLIRHHFPELPGHVVLVPPENDTNPVSFFDLADYGLTVRGTIGLELPCFGIPVLTAGTGGYSGRGFTYDSATAAEYLEKLDSIHHLPPLDKEQVELAQRYTNAVFFLKPIPIESFTWVSRPPPLDELRSFDFVVRVRTREELERAPDLSIFADWVVRSSAPDLILPDPAAESAAAAAARSR